MFSLTSEARGAGRRGAGKPVQGSLFPHGLGPPTLTPPWALRNLSSQAPFPACLCSVPGGSRSLYSLLIKVTGIELEFFFNFLVYFFSAISGISCTSSCHVTRHRKSHYCWPVCLIRCISHPTVLILLFFVSIGAERLSCAYRADIPFYAYVWKHGFIALKLKQNQWTWTVK